MLLQSSFKSIKARLNLRYRSKPIMKNLFETPFEAELMLERKVELKSLLAKRRWARRDQKKSLLKQYSVFNTLETFILKINSS